MTAWEMLIEPRRRPVGSGFVDRLLPFRKRRMVGPFIFADLMGPEQLDEGVGSDVAVHPHLGLATVTYLFSGAITHRDSTGAVQDITPGAVNWMTAGAGVTHSERSPDWVRAKPVTMAGLQTWVALPDDSEDVAASFVHVAADDVPAVEGDRATGRLIAGSYGGLDAPVPTMSPMFYVDVVFEAGGRFPLPAPLGQRAVVAVDGEVRVGHDLAPLRHLAVVGDGDTTGDVVVSGDAGARAVVLGGAALGQRFIDWNFVASSKARLAAARERWAEFDFPLVPGDDELVPLPG